MVFLAVLFLKSIKRLRDSKENTDGNEIIRSQERQQIPDSEQPTRRGDGGTDSQQRPKDDRNGGRGRGLDSSVEKDGIGVRGKLRQTLPTSSSTQRTGGGGGHTRPSMGTGDNAVVGVPGVGNSSLGNGLKRGKLDTDPKNIKQAKKVDVKNDGQRALTFIVVLFLKSIKFQALNGIFLSIFMAFEEDALPLPSETSGVRVERPAAASLSEVIMRSWSSS